MRRRRVTPRGTGRTGSASVPAHPGLSQAFDESYFPVDDLPPDDLPVRDITADLDEPYPADVSVTRVVDQAGGDPADPAHGTESAGSNPLNPRSSADHGPFGAAPQHEPADGTSSLAPEVGAKEAHAQYSLPGLGFENTLEVQPNPGKRKSKRPGQRRGSPKSTLRPAQIELWPED